MRLAQLLTVAVLLSGPSLACSAPTPDVSSAPRPVVREAGAEAAGDVVRARCFVRNDGERGMVHVEAQPVGSDEVQRTSVVLARGEARMIAFYFSRPSPTGYRCVVPETPAARAPVPHDTTAGPPALVISFGLFGLVLCLAALFWMAWWGPRRDGRRWAETARQLGLHLEPFAPGRHRHGLRMTGPSVHQAMLGTRGGVAVRVWLEARLTYRSNVAYSTHVGAEIPENLGLGLQAAPVGWLSRMFQAVTGQRDLRVGIEELDRRYDIRAMDEQGATVLRARAR